MLHGLASNIQSFITLFKFITMFMGPTIFHIIFPTFKLNVKMFREILSVPKNTLMDLNNVCWDFGLSTCVK
jgi:hypothetical protein